MPRYWLNENVYDAALKRIERIFHEFPRVVVNFSGGKDSTVTFNLALEVARKLGRLPLHVMWIDQEAEWDHVVSYVRSVMNHPDVEPIWFQGPFKIFNATTTGDDPWLHAWEEGGDWIRAKEPNSIHENNTGEDRFINLFEGITRSYFGIGKNKEPYVAHLAGVRCEESPARRQGLTCYACYKDITWGQARGQRWGQYAFYPLYDWSYTDIWKAIHEHDWRYCEIYDFMYQHGLPIRKMRVSNVHHETAIDSLKFLQELEPETWDRVVSRVEGVNSVSKGWDLYKVPQELPFMFKTWVDYRDHLLENLILDPEAQKTFRHQFYMWDRQFEPEVFGDLVKMEIAAILVNDHHGTKFSSFSAAHGAQLLGRGKMTVHERARMKKELEAKAAAAAGGAS